METSNLTCLGGGSASSQGGLEEGGLSSICSSSMLIGPSPSTGSIQSCGVMDLLSATSTMGGGFLSPVNTTANLDCTLKCSVTVTVPAQVSSFKSNNGSRINSELSQSANSRGDHSEEFIQIRQKPRRGFLTNHGSESGHIFSAQECQHNQDTRSEPVNDPDFDGLDLSSDDQDSVPIGEILDKLQSNSSLDSPQSSSRSHSSNLIRLHAAHPDSDSPTISATVNVAALDLSDPDSIYRHLSQLNDTVLRVSAKNFSPPASGQQSPIPFDESPIVNEKPIQVRDVTTPTPCSNPSSPISASTIPSVLSNSTPVLTTLSSSGSAGNHSAFKPGNNLELETPIQNCEGTTFLPSSIQLPTSPLALASSCSPTPPSTVMTISSSSSSSSTSNDPMSQTILVKNSNASNSNLATKTSPQSCAICFKVFSNASALAKHRLTHSEERRYHCNICSKAFKRQDHLNGHLLTHRSTKPFACQVDGCGKSYCDARSLRRHKENHHSSGSKTHTQQQHTLMTMPQLTISTPTTTSNIAIPIKEEPILATSTSSLVSRTSLGDTKIMFSSKGLTAQQLQLIEQLLKESRGGKLNPVPQSSNLPTMPPPPSINVTFPVPQSPNFAPTLVASPAVSPHVSTTSVGQRKGPTSTNDKASNSSTPDKPVECTICNRKFKNIPALNGHMRLHGGYYKKDSEGKRITATSIMKLGCKLTKNNMPPKPGIKRKSFSSPQQNSVPEKKMSLCPVNVQSSLSCLQPVTAAIFSVSSSTPPISTLPGGSILTVDTPLKPIVPAEGSIITVPQNSLAFQSLPPPDTKKLLENLEKKNFEMMNIKNEQMHHQQHLARMDTFSQIKDKSNLLKTSTPLKKGIGVKEQKPHTVLVSSFEGGQFQTMYSLPPIALPTKPIPQLQLENPNLVSQDAGYNNNKVTEGKFILVEGSQQVSKSQQILHSPPIITSSSSTILRFTGSDINCAAQTSFIKELDVLQQISTNTTNIYGSICSPPTLTHLIQASSTQTVFKQIHTLNHSAKTHHMLKVDYESDKTPKIGSDYQAVIPDYMPEIYKSVKSEMNSDDTLLWSPHLPCLATTIDDYLMLASSCVVPFGSHNEELALELLLKHSGKVTDALQDLLAPGRVQADDDDVSQDDIEYEEDSEDGASDLEAYTSGTTHTKRSWPWSELEVNSFYEGLVKFRKDFAEISKQVGTKTVKECIEFYYLWKNFCRDEANSFKSIFFASNPISQTKPISEPSGRDSSCITSQYLNQRNLSI